MVSRQRRGPSDQWLALIASTLPLRSPARSTRCECVRRAVPDRHPPCCLGCIAAYGDGIRVVRPRRSRASPSASSRPSNESGSRIASSETPTKSANVVSSVSARSRSPRSTADNSRTLTPSAPATSSRAAPAPSRSYCTRRPTPAASPITLKYRTRGPEPQAAQLERQAHSCCAFSRRDTDAQVSSDRVLGRKPARGASWPAALRDPLDPDSRGARHRPLAPCYELPCLAISGG